MLDRWRLSNISAETVTSSVLVNPLITEFWILTTLKKESCWKHCGKRRKCCDQHFLLYPQCFLTYQRLFCYFRYILIVIRFEQLEQRIILSFVNPFPHNYTFWRPWETSLLKTLWNAQFLLFPQCFLPVWITFCHFGQIWNCRLQTLSAWKSLKSVVW